MSTVRTAVNALGYEAYTTMTDNDQLAYKAMYNEKWSYYYFTSSQLQWYTVYFDESKYSVDDLRNYLSNILKYTYVKQEGNNHYYLLPDGKSWAKVYISDTSRWITFQAPSASAPSMAPSMIEEQQMKDIANQAAKMPKHETTRSTRDADSFAKDVERINKRIANRLK